MPSRNCFKYTIINEGVNALELAQEVRKALQQHTEVVLGGDKDSNITIILSLGDEHSSLTLPNGTEHNVMTWLRNNTKGLVHGGYAILYFTPGISADQQALLTAKPDENDVYKDDLLLAKQKLLHAFDDITTLLEAIDRLPPELNRSIIYSIHSTQEETGASECVARIHDILGEYVYYPWEVYKYPEVFIILSLTDEDNGRLKTVLRAAASGAYRLLLFCPIYLTTGQIRMIVEGGGKPFSNPEELLGFFSTL